MSRSHSFSLKFKMGNAAFFNDEGQYDPTPEIHRIVERIVAETVKSPSAFSASQSFPIRDVNGNTIGECKIT